MAACSREKPTAVRPELYVSGRSSDRDARRASADATPRRSRSRAEATGRSGDEQSGTGRARAVALELGCAVRQQDRTTKAWWNEVDARAWREAAGPRIMWSEIRRTCCTARASPSDST